MDDVNIQNVSRWLKERSDLWPKKHGGASRMETLFSMGKDCRTGRLRVSTALFSRDCALMASAKHSKEYHVSIVPHAEDQVEITLARKDGEKFDEMLLRELMNELIDCQIRLNLQKEFGEIRKKIVEYAFSPVE